MGRLISWLVICGGLSLQAQSLQTLDRLKHFGEVYMNRLPDIVCVALPTTSQTNLIIDLVDVQHDGASLAGNSEIRNLLQSVFSPASGTVFKWDRWATIRRHRTAAYGYALADGRGGWIYADEITGTIARITLQAAGAPAHLSCSQERQ
jgi:hypothetical protein